MKNELTTVPWHEDEFAIVNGVPVVYYICPQLLTFVYRLPGVRGAFAAVDLALAGYTLVKPKRLRVGSLMVE